jgi:hypothetical protein
MARGLPPRWLPQHVEALRGFRQLSCLSFGTTARKFAEVEFCEAVLGLYD